MIKSIIQKIKALPPLPSTFQKINETVNDPDKTVADLVNIIQKDPMLTANLLKIANSPLYGFQKEIKTLSQAVSLFGMAMTRTLAMNLSIKQILKADMKPYGISSEEFASICHLQSSLAKKWYFKVDPKKTETIFLMALLQETGKVIIADEIKEREEIEEFKEVIKSSIDIEETEKTFVGCSSSEVTTAIFEHWNFDKLIVNAIKHSHEYKNAPEDIKNYSIALKVIKTAVPLNAPLSEESVQRAVEILEREKIDSSCFMEKVLELGGVFA